MERKELEELKPAFERVLFFNPSEVFARMGAAEHGDRFKRINRLNMAVLFPKTEGRYCDCGCGVMLTGRRSRWATEDCKTFALGVYWILCGKLDGYERYIYRYYGHACKACGIMYEDMHIDHITPVFAGGGGCWLSNFQLLCIDCHKKKTKADYKLYRNAKG